MLKRFLSSPVGIAIAAWLAAGYIRLVWATSRWDVVGRENAQGLLDSGQVAIAAFWHARLLMMPRILALAEPRPRFAMMISSHRDGRLIAATIAHFGISTVFGSSTRGGPSAALGMKTALDAGHWVGITPDGPRGPRMRAQPGVTAIARYSGAPVVPVSYSTTRGTLLRSWDRMLLPFPFGRGVFVVGAPIAVPADAAGDTLERLRREVETALTAATATADRLCGRETPAPSP